MQQKFQRRVDGAVPDVDALDSVLVSAFQSCQKFVRP